MEEPGLVWVTAEHDVERLLIELNTSVFGMRKLKKYESIQKSRA